MLLVCYIFRRAHPTHELDKIEQTRPNPYSILCKDRVLLEKPMEKT